MDRLSSNSFRRDLNAPLLQHSSSRVYEETVVKFRVGQTVLFLDPYRHGPRERYVIVNELPERDGEVQYKIRKEQEHQERVAKQSQLRAV